MSNSSFRIFKVPDRELLSSLNNIANEFNASEQSSFSLSLFSGSPNISVSATQIDSNTEVQQVLSAESAIFEQITFSSKIAGSAYSIYIKREENSDQANVSFNDVKLVGQANIAQVLAVVHKYLKAYARTESIDKLLGDELSEFYRRREEGLLRLETLSEKLLRQNEEYRQKVDFETTELRRKLTDDLDSAKDNLSNEYKEKEQALKTREGQLEERIQNIDDSDSKHARRDIRQDFKKEIAARSKEFTLSQATIDKRGSVKISFIYLFYASMLSATTAVLLFAFGKTEILSFELHIGLSLVAFAATSIYYIRWNDNWFRQHADEEFRLKRLDLDIDRASWVVEMALEWKEEKGSEIPEELIDRLTRNLFAESSDRGPVKHPSEDLASAFLNASSGLKVKIPGFGEASFNRRGMKNFRKKSEETQKES